MGASLSVRPAVTVRDEAEVLSLAREHALDCFLGRPAGAVSLAGFSDGAQRELRQAHRRVLAQNLERLDGLARVATILAEQAIDVAPLKGLWLIERLYRDPGARSMVDTDLLVHPKQFHDALLILQRAGYRIARPVPFERFPLRFFWSREVTDAQTGQHIDLHRFVAHQAMASVDPAGLLDRAQTRVHRGTPWLTLAPEDVLLHLAVHQAKHGFLIRLRDTVDIAALAQRPLDWDALSDRATGAGARSMLWVALEMAARALHAPMPEPLRRSLAPAPARRAWLEQHLDLDGGTGLRAEAATPGQALEAVLSGPVRVARWRLTHSLIQFGAGVRSLALDWAKPVPDGITDTESP